MDSSKFDEPVGCLTPFFSQSGQLLHNCQSCSEIGSHAKYSCNCALTQPYQLGVNTASCQSVPCKSQPVIFGKRHKPTCKRIQQMSTLTPHWKHVGLWGVKDTRVCWGNRNLLLCMLHNKLLLANRKVTWDLPLLDLYHLPWMFMIKVQRGISQLVCSHSKQAHKILKPTPVGQWSQAAVLEGQSCETFRCVPCPTHLN